ncbi:MAG: DinB family protein [Pseudomonadota bacterium]
MSRTPITRAYLQSMAQYNSWMNGKIYETAARLPAEEIARDRGAFFKSILGTLNHLLAADMVWIDRFKSRPLRFTDLRSLRHRTFEPLRAERLAIDAEIADWAAGVDEDWLARPFTFTSVLTPASYTYPASVLVMHFFNHQTHHRGQITTLLTQVGEDVGVTDFIGLPGLKEMVV